MKNIWKGIYVYFGNIWIDKNLFFIIDNFSIRKLSQNLGIKKEINSQIDSKLDSVNLKLEKFESVNKSEDNYRPKCLLSTKKLF